MAPLTPPPDAVQSHCIVALEAQFCAIPKFDFPEPLTYTITTYPKTPHNQIAERIRDATILITTTIRLDAETLSANVCPKLQLIAVMATGVDSIDLAACKKRGITVFNCGGANVTAVSEHTIGMYFAARRRFTETQAAIRAGLWPVKGTLIPMMEDENRKMPLTCAEETLGLIGYGAIGQRIERLAKALGLQVIVSDRKGAKTLRSGRVSFEDCIQKSTVLVMVIPRTPETIGLISTAELERMPASALLINVSRGDIVDEAAVVAAVRSKTIAGAAFDVFSREPADAASSPLLSDENKDLNILTTPHTAWLANSTMTSLQNMVKEGLEGWLTGAPKNVVV